MAQPPYLKFVVRLQRMRNQLTSERQKYLLPHLRPPTATAYEADRDALTAQFDAAEAMLKEIHAETNAVRIAMEEQKEKVDKTTEEINIIIAEMRNDEAKTRDELREMREEVGNVRDMLPKVRRFLLYV